MSKTKTRILNTALELFNSKGLAKVTLRSIANEMGISQGNLNYHYKKRAEILNALYFQLVEEMDEALAGQQTQEFGLPTFFHFSKVMMGKMYAYRFFFLDFVQIVRENELIRNHYLELSKLRTAQFMGMFGLLIQKGILRPEILPDEYLHLYERFHIQGDFWLSSAAIISKEMSPDVVDHYFNIFHGGIFPYLTEKGVVEYREMIVPG